MHEPVRIRHFLLLLLLSGLFLAVGGVLGQEVDLSPSEIPGEAIYIPFPVEINLDGDLADWNGIPIIEVTQGSMLSSIPGENDRFTFAVAADLDNIYITMTMADKNIITNQHGTETWNEDSLEFFLNLTDDINLGTYQTGIFQIRIIPADIGNDDPNSLTIDGVFSTGVPVTGYVFETEDGWGFEAAVSIADYITPEHGKEIGFQAQANGATESSRDVKLIWSNADTTDNSWQDPSLFGTGIFFEVGQSEVPLPSDRDRPEPEAEPEELPPVISVNQVGYFPDSPKIAAFASVSTTPIPWTLSQAGTEMASGSTIMIGDDASSGDFLHQIDFSEFEETGHDFVLEAGELVSEPFDISESVYAGLKEDALEYFYLSRSGIELEQSYAGEWARAAGHMSDDKVTCYRGEDADGNQWPGCDYTIDASGGWYDAGDYGKYVVNGGITTWTLLNMYERNPDSFPDGSLSIPEANNGNSDLLDEARWEIEFLLSMQVPEGQEKAGLVHHKLHDRTWETMPALPVTERDNDNENQDPEDGRYLYMPTTAATLNLAAVGAQCARIWEEIDPDFAAECLRAAEIAWGAAVENPTIFAGNTPGSGGGNYDDQNVSDEFYWAAAELFTTTGEAEYYDFLNETPLLGSLPTPISSMTWDNTAALGTLTLALVPNQLEEEVVAELRENIISAADHYLNVLDREGYRMPISSFEWGSNSFILNNMIVMGYAFEFTGDDAYLNGMTESMDYLMGRNPVSMSYVTGFGERAAQHPHHRFWANDPDRGWPAPPPGVVVGGPNATADDPPFNSSGLNDMAAAKRYLDDLESFSTNEVAINWNAPLVWTATAIEEYKSGIIPDRQAIGAPAESADAGTQTTSDSESDEDSGSLPAWPIFVGIGVLAIAGFVIGWRLRKNPKAAEK